MKTKSFFNTTGLSGDALKEAVANAEKQEFAIWLIFLNTRLKFTASDITRLTKRAGHKWPLHSNRRAITNLKTDGEIVMLSEKKIGQFGAPEHFYVVNPDRYPSPQPVQKELFL